MRKIYSLVLMAVGLLIGTNAFGAGDITGWSDEADAISKGAVCKIGTEYYSTLALAVADVPTDKSETQITMVADATISSTVTIANTKNVVLELNGKVIRLGDGCSGNMIENNGILTIQDCTDYLVSVLDAISLQPMEGIQQYRGNGSGKITCSYSNPDLSGNPTKTSNAIRNNAILYVKSGWIENLSDGSASFAIDLYSSSKTYISGGKISSNQSNSIRMFCPNNQSIEITGGEIYRIWVQDGTTASNVASLSIMNATLTQGLLVGYNDVIEHFTLTMNNCIVGDYIIYELPAVETNVLSLNNCKSGALFMINPRPILVNGLFSFTKTCNAGWAWIETFAEDFPASEGWSMGTDVWYDDDTKAYIEGETCDYCEWAEAWLSPEGHVRSFYDYIADGYGLVARPDVGEGWYEVALTQGTTDAQDVEGHDGELGNPWHQDKTWNLTESDVVPQDTTPVLIDHNVFVEENMQAVAASLQIKAGQTLTVKSGATLQIQDAGALFKDETAQLVIEPNAVVTVGSNGVVSQDEKNIIIHSSETEQGVFMCHPDVKLNTQPKATVYLYTKAQQIAGAPKYEYIYQRFAIPTADGAATVYDADYSDQELFAGETSYVDAVYGWDNTKLNWQMLARWKDMEPFVGYQVTNNTKNGGITYSFKGNLVGNHDGNFEFASHPDKFQFFGNSYTAPIYIPTFLDSITKNNPTVQQSIWIYDEGDDNFKPVTKYQAQYGLVTYQNGDPIKEIRSMQAFIMCGDEGNVTELSYEDAIWGNPRFNGHLGGTEKAPQRIQQLEMSVATIRIEATNGQADEVTLLESNEFTQDFDNGADASKYMYAEGINLYANTNSGKQTVVASDNVEGTILGFKAGASENYTIRFNNLNGEEFTLVDLDNQQRVDMRAGAMYNFCQKAHYANEARFMVVRRAPSVTTDMDEVNNTNSTIKVVENGQLIIIKNGVRYNALGVEF